jgi:hypothetical protein
MGAIIKFGAAASDELEGDANGSAFATLRDNAGNPVAPANGLALPAAQGVLLIGGVNDDNARGVRVDRSGALASALHSVLLQEPFEGATIHPHRWVAASTTFVPAQTVLGWAANPTNVVTANAVTVLTSRAQFPKLQRVPLQYKARVRTNRVANVQQEFGFGAPVGTAIPANGAFFRVAGDVLTAVVTFNGVEIAAVTMSAALSGLLPAWDTLFITYDIVVDDDEAKFYVQNSATGQVILETRVQLPATQNRLWAVSHLQCFARCFNGAVAPATPGVLIVSDMIVTQLDAHAGFTAAELAALNELGGDKNPLTGVQLAINANSAEPGNSALSNTTAASTALGGKFQFGAPAGAATDYQLFHFQVPAPYEYVLQGIDIDVWNVGAAVATTPHLLTWTVGVNGTAVGAITSHIRTMVGAQNLPVATPIGGQATPISKRFPTPLVCKPGLFLAIILRIPVGTATASQIIAGHVTPVGYFR